MTYPIAMTLPIGIDHAYTVAALGALAGLLIGWPLRRYRSRAEGSRAGSPAVWVSALAALGCTAYSAETSWSFAADYLGMTAAVQRAALFSTAELALFANALLARQNLRSQGAPGVPGSLVWVLTGVQIIPAFAESGPIGGTVRAIVGPVMAAMLWHLTMGIELRLRKPDALSQGVLATLGREARERLLSRLGLSARNRDAAQITRDRATSRAVTLASRLAGLPEEKRTTARGRRISRRLESALARSGVGTDPEQRRALLEQLAARRHAAALATVDLPSPWIPSPRHPGDCLGDRTSLTPTATRAANEAVPWLSTVPTTGSANGLSIGDRPNRDRSNGDRPGTDIDPGGDQADTVPGTDETDGDVRSDPETVHEAAAHRAKVRSSATVPTDSGDRQHRAAEPGTGPGRDRPNPGTGDSGDRRHPGTGTGTDLHGDRPQVPHGRRKPRAKGRRNRLRTREPKRSQLTVNELVERVRPDVPVLLERDGNESLTRVQLREILRGQQLGVRNERLTPVLQQLRTEAGAATTRRTAR